MIDATSTMRRGATPSRSQLRHDSTGRPHAFAASFTLPQLIRWRISASRAPNVESSGTQLVELCIPCVVVTTTGYDG
jgi:hypothetical protein